MKFNEVVLKSSSQNPAVKYKVFMEQDPALAGVAEAAVLSCSCPGYKHRRQCRHVKEVAQEHVRTEMCPSCGETAWSQTTLVGGADALICDNCDFSVSW